jgi:hypothetical protein
MVVIEFILLLVGVVAAFAVLTLVVILAIWAIDDYWFAP